MSQPDQESAGDYGYDLVHEDIRRASAADESAGHPAPDPHQGASPARGKQDPSDDLGYDQAHDF